jgi:MFS superfamily sulfate permease-like transporter
VVYRFASDLFYVNANLFLEDLTSFANSKAPLSRIIIDAGAITDIDFTGSLTLKQVQCELAEHDITLVFADVMSSVKRKLDRYGITEVVGEDAFYRTVGIAVKAYSGTSSN